jgi:hypothetical protein
MSTPNLISSRRQDVFARSAWALTQWGTGKSDGAMGSGPLSRHDTIHKDYAMRHSHTSRISAKAFFAVVSLAFAGACADSVSAPTSDVSAKGPAGFDRVIGVERFRYTPNTGVSKRIGDHMIVMPAGSICDPATSGYGPEFWDAPCTPVNHSIVITATTMADVEGHPYIQFLPDLRFAPTKEVYLYLKDSKHSRAQNLSINWCPTGSATCIDEAALDPSLATERVGKSSILGRRLKHVSGYSITARGDCSGGVTVGDDGGLVCLDAGFARSGYILASGLGKSNNGSLGRRKKLAEQ